MYAACRGPGRGRLRDSSAPPEVPANLRPPAGQVMFLEALASGVQIYECAPKADQPAAYEWAFRAPEAPLVDRRGRSLGKHYAGPTWESTDGSSVVGEVKARDPGPVPTAIPWLLLNAKSTAGAGVFGATKSIQRVQTVGGLPHPALRCRECQAVGACPVHRNLLFLPRRPVVHACFVKSSDLTRQLPRNKDDAEGAAALIALGYPTVEPVLRHMLEWLKTNGSPVDLLMREFFVSLGVAGVPVVRAALQSRHDLLKYAVTTHVVARWPAEAVAGVQAELQVLATGSGFYGTDLVAMKLLIEHALADRAWLAEWSAFKIKRLRELLASAEELQVLLGAGR